MLDYLVTSLDIDLLALEDLAEAAALVFFLPI
jgi:hypothetical protein